MGFKQALSKYGETITKFPQTPGDSIKMPESIYRRTQTVVGWFMCTACTQGDLEYNVGTAMMTAMITDLLKLDVASLLDTKQWRNKTALV